MQGTNKIGSFEKLKQDLIHEFGYAEATVRRMFAENIGNTSGDRCANCGSNMLEEIFTFDYADALLLIAMAKVVRIGTDTGKSFTDANSVRVVGLETSDAVRHRTTQSAKLGLIAKHMIKNSAGKPTQKLGHWVITARGWSALRGDPVPRRVAVFRGNIEERFEDKTTLSEALRTNKNKAKQIVDYSPAIWVEYGRRHEGRLI